VPQHTRIHGAAATPTLEPLSPARLSEARDVLAAAFRDNPLNTAVIGSDPGRRLRANRHGMGAMLPVAVEHGIARAALCGGRLSGVLVAAPPGRHPLPPPPLPTRLRTWLGQGWHVARRWAEVFERLDALHPDEPHWYLATLGVAPDRQGRGVGRALLGEFLALVERDALPAYLETDRRAAVRLYEASGFAVLSQTAVLGVTIWLMGRRPPAP
jgi:ribosomal protein S18 acetylase RimI-like enzyme